MFGDIQKVNASLALQLTRTWMENKENKGIITGEFQCFYYEIVWGKCHRDHTPSKPKKDGNNKSRGLHKAYNKG